MFISANTQIADMLKIEHIYFRFICRLYVDTIALTSAAWSYFGFVIYFIILYILRILGPNQAFNRSVQRVIPTKLMIKLSKNPSFQLENEVT